MKQISPTDFVKNEHVLKSAFNGLQIDFTYKYIDVYLNYSVS